MLLEKGLEMQAVKDYDEAIKIDPKFESALYNQAISYENMKDSPSAIRSYEQLLKINPQHERALYGIAG